MGRKKKLKLEEVIEKPAPKPIVEEYDPPKLQNYKRDLFNPNKRLVFAVGLPSTGKTKKAIEAGIEQVMRMEYEKLIIIRPVLVPEAGLLKGDLLEKMQPYIRQSGIYIEKYEQFTMEDLIKSGRVEILSVDLLQGNRFQNCFVVADEMQNVHMRHTFAFLSRVGEGCKYVVIGDISRGQCNKKIKQGETLLDYCLNKFGNKEYCSIHRFYDTADILGDSVTKDIIITLMEDFV